MKTIAAAALMALAAPMIGVASGPAYMVADLKTEQGPWELESFGFLDSAVLGSYVYFRASDGVHGEEIWRWSPAGGAEMVADVCPGICSSLPIELVALEDRIFFRADDGSHGAEVWVTDGSAAGTRLVSDIEPGLATSGPLFLTPYDGRLYFAAGRGFSEGRELWVSDGTEAGTAQVIDIRPGAEGSSPVSLAEFQGLLYFTADDGVAGRELWRSDGTPGGTWRVLDLCAGPDPCFWEEQWVPHGSRVLQPLGARLLLLPEAPGADALQVYDPGLGAVESLADGIVSAFFPLPVLDGVAYFASCPGSQGDCELWRTDGWPAGTYRVKDVRPGPEGADPRPLGVAAGVVFFYASGDGEGQELWKTDGTEPGTSFVKDVNPGPDSSRTWVIAPGTPVGDRLVFGADDGVHGAEFWSTDGSESGTVLLADMNPGAGYAIQDFFFPHRPTEVEGRLAVLAIDDEAGFRLWQTDGTPAGTSLVGDLDLQASAMPSSLFHGPILRAGAFGDRLLFGATERLHGTELWSSDGTAAGTGLVADLAPGVDSSGRVESSRPWFFADAGDRAFVSATLGVWATDGSEAGTEELASRYAGAPVTLRPRANSRGAFDAFFVAQDHKLFVSDGTPAGTTELADEAGSVHLAGQTLVFPRVQGATGREPWRTDGSPGGAELILDILPGGYGSEPSLLGSFEGRVLFSASDGLVGAELWATDGSTPGTELVADIRPGAVGSEPSLGLFAAEPVVTSRGLFFQADDGERGREPWVSDGTPAGTRRIQDLRFGAAPSDPVEFVAAGERVFFLADDGVHGRELWRYRPELGRARLVADIHPGSGSSVPYRRLGSRLVYAGGRLYLGATNGLRGVELWTSDGTRAGTHLLQDINPGPGSSSPENFVVAGDCLYFSATDGQHGFELWALPLRGAPGSCLPAAAPGSR